MDSTAIYEEGLFINNEYVKSLSEETLTVRNAYDQSILSSDIQVAGQADVDLAVKCARDAFQTWRFSPTRVRVEAMLNCAKIFESRSDEIAKLESICMGCPMMLATKVASTLSGYFRYYAGLVDKVHGETYAEDEDGLFKMILREPLGVCAGIAGWNATPIFAGLKIAAAVAAGNTVVFKSSEKSPLGTLYLGAIFKEAGFPPGVINLLSGGPTTGSLLASHMGVAKISFTGSREAGKKVQIAAATSNLKHVSLELGGKSASIVFSDAAFENAVLHNSRMFLLNNAQVCSAASRVLVQDAIADKFVSALRDSFRSASPGDPSDPETMFGPLADTEQASRVRSFIKDAESQGLQVVAGGSGQSSIENWVQPTIFYNPPESSAVYKQEVFGPVLTVNTFSTETEAIAMANNSCYGLAGKLHFISLGLP
ncbi:aldehyde dehydrogenase like protein [Zymoseptoria brevis]|uniref:aldehyde dehydrogenase (NAD(+)) n=1 Tax=Zymoseptoria brevis TaxID=1047168 RepID=A0A0F4GXD7_9PEZI|nr:aldehyde dehydrogenase like protein [Zymoseptoria brevis]